MENKEIIEESISDLTKENFDDSLIKDNKLCFIIEDALYRVRMPNQGEQSFIEHKRNLAQLDYMKQPGCITKNQLIRQLKENNIIDIQQLESEKDDLIKKLKQNYFDLATKDSEDIKRINELTNNIVTIKDTLQNLSIEIGNALSPCLESRTDKFYIEYLTNMCTEIYENNSWKAVWNSFDDFNKTDSNLTNKVIANMTWLWFNKRI